MGDDPTDRADTTGEVMVQLWAHPIPQTAYLAEHMYVVITDTKTGARYYFRAGPTGKGVPDWGTLHGVAGAYETGSVDFKTNSHVVQTLVNNNDPVGPYLNKAEAFENENNANNTSYYPLKGPNSNSYAEQLGEDLSGKPRTNSGINTPAQNVQVPGVPSQKSSSPSKQANDDPGLLDAVGLAMALGILW